MENTEEISTEEASTENSPPAKKAAKKTVKKKTGRDPVTNLYSSIDYEYDNLGRVNWKNLIPSEFLAANRDKLGNKDIDASTLTKEEIASLPEEDKLVLLQGFKEVLDIRGYSSFEESTKYFESVKGADKAVTTCRIEYLGIPETNNKPLVITTTGEAHYHNTVGFGQNYLCRISANRALVANARLALRIPILGQDELGGNQPSEGSPGAKGSPHLYKAVESLYEENGYSFDKIKNRLYSEFPETQGASSFKDLDKYPKILQHMSDSILKGK